MNNICKTENFRACSPNLSIIETPEDELNNAHILDSDDEYYGNENNFNCSQKKLVSFDNLLINLTEKNNNVLSSFIDTGSALSLIKANVFADLESRHNFVKKQATSLAKPIEGNLIVLQHKVLLEFRLNNRLVKHFFYIFEGKEDAFPADILLGCDVLKKFDFKCNLSDSTPVELLGVKFAINQNKENKVKINRKRSSMGISAPMLVNQRDLENLGNVTVSKNEKSKNLSEYCMHMCVKGEQTILANSVKHIKCFLGARSTECKEKHDETFTNFGHVNKTVVDSNLDNNSNFKEGFNNSFVSKSRTISGRVKVPNCMFSVKENDTENVFFIPVANCGNENFVLKNCAVLAEAECLEYDELTPKLDRAPDIFPLSFNEQLENFELNQLSHLNENEKSEVLNIMKVNKEAFTYKEHPIGRFVNHKVSIPTNKNVEFVYKAQYRLPQAYREPLSKITSELLEQGVIKPSYSPWNSPILLTKKPNGDFRFVLDCRAVNKETISLVHPLPRVDETIERLNGKKYFSSLDAKSGFHQLPIDEVDQHKTSFRTQDGQFQFCRLPFGMRNASFQFQRALEEVLKEALNDYAQVYVDDIVLFSSSFNDHLRDLDKILKLLIKGGVRLSMNKCQIAKNEIKYLGYIVNGDHIRPSQEKLKAVREFPEPKCPKDIKRFLGLCGFYRQCIQGFSKITVPLSELLKKDKIWKWGVEEQDSFETLKEALCKEPILRHPDFSKNFEVHCDASDQSIGSSLMQSDGEISYPVCYYSRKIGGSELNYSVTEKEALAVIEAVKHWHYYLAERPFTVVSDHAPLAGCFKKSNNLHGRLARWAVYMQMYDFEIKYKKGELNKLPDLLSRPPMDENVANVCVLTEGNEQKQNENDLFSEINIRKAQETDEFCSAIYKNIIKNKTCKIPLKTSLSEFFVEENILYFLPNNSKSEFEIKPRVVIPKSLINEALDIAHCQNTSAHYGYVKTLFNFRNKFYVPNSIKIIKDHVASCLPCAKRKHANVPKAPLGSFPPVYAAGERIGVDIIGPLTPTEDNNIYCLTLVDHFSRFTTLVALPDKTAQTVANVIVNYILRHSSPSCIVSDRGLENLNEIMEQVCNLLKISQIPTTAFNPKANSLVEVRNREIENVLSFLCSERPELWDTYTQYVCAALNSSISTATKYTPFYLYHGREYQMNFGDIFAKLKPIYTDELAFADEIKIRMQRTYEAVNNYCKKHKVQYHKQYNRKAKTRNFKVNNLVMLKNNARKGKLSQRWLGPFRIIKVIEARNNLIIKDTSGKFKEKAVHMDRCKRYSPKTDDYPKFETIPDFDNQNDSDRLVTCRYNLRNRV